MNQTSEARPTVAVVRLTLLLTAFPAIGCEFPVATKDYRVDTGPRATLIDAFAADDAECAKDLSQSCSSALSACLDESGCSEFSACVRALADPVATTKCQDRLGASLDAQWAYEELSRCWSQLSPKCKVGQDFRCLGHYDLPHSERSEFTLSEKVQYFKNEQAAPDFAVAACVRTTDCSEPTARIPLDDKLRYTVTVPWGTKLGGPGSDWDGYRLLTSPSILPSHVESNLPVWGMRVTVTRVVPEILLESWRSAFHADQPEAIFVQVVDCQSAPAPGIVVTLTNAEQGTIIHDDGGPTTMPKTGAAVIFNLKLDGVIEIVARRSAALGELGTEVARHRVTLPRGHAYYLRMYPEPP